LNAAQRYARLSPEDKAKADAARQERNAARGKLIRQWWASLTPEQKTAQSRKISSGKLNPVAKPGKKKGENSHLSKLTEETVRAIHADMRAAKVIAAEYGIDPGTVRKIWKGLIWSHLNLPILERPSYQVKSRKVPAPKMEPLLSDDQKIEIQANPWVGTKELAASMGVHWMAVATYRHVLAKKGLR
jgi:hypothetical protein